MSLFDSSNNYDIFISYRRDNGEDKAKILNQFLSTVGYRVFFDHESEMTGEFETEILAAVEIAPVFLIILTPHCLDRCIDENDWVRREIERATKFGKDIIPIRPNYDESIFMNLPEGIPDYVMRLKELEFAEIDFHKNFIATAQSVVDTQIRKVVQPSIDTSNLIDTNQLSPAKKIDTIFISYKRQNKKTVFRIKSDIERATNESCWIDLDGIESDAQFANVIIEAINKCKVFLFMYSHEHQLIQDYDNDWTVREINFAQKKKKRIVFINIDGSPLTDWFELMFGTKQQIDASSKTLMDKLCADLKKWLK